jgi:hypothetical protein
MFSKEYPDIFKNTLVYTVHVWPSRRFKVCLPLLNLHVRLAQKDSEKVSVSDGEMGTHTQQIRIREKREGFFLIGTEYGSNSLEHQEISGHTIGGT